MIEFLFRGLSRLPIWMLYLLADVFYFYVRYVIGYRKRVITDNLTAAFPELSPQEIARLRGRFYRNLTDFLAEAIKAISMSPEMLARRVTLADLGGLEAMIASNQPVILMATHQGNWEWVLLRVGLALGIPLSPVYKPLHDASINALMFATRSRFGATPIASSHVFIELAKRKKDIKAFAILADQRPLRNEEKLWLRFLNQDTPFFVGTEKLARITGYPVFFLAVRRTGRGHYEVRAKPLGQTSICKPGQAGHELLECYSRETEALIREDPAAWLWSHRRWKYNKPLYT